MIRTNKNKCDVHFFTDFDEYELIKRSAYDERIEMAESIRRKYFTLGWREKLQTKRLKHRKQKIEDQRFWHPKQNKQGEK